jgi:hypothetical protein
MAGTRRGLFSLALASGGATPLSQSMTVSLKVEANEVHGELAVVVPPGTIAAKRDALVDELLTEPLFEIARKMCAVLAADPHAFARPLNGHDAEGRTRFEVHGRVEADRLIPIGRGTRRTRG